MAPASAEPPNGGEASGSAPRVPYAERQTFNERHLAYDPTETEEETRAIEGRSKFLKALRASANGTLVISEDAVAALDAEREAMPNMENPKVAARRLAMARLWLKFLQAIKPDTKKEDAWNVPMIKRYIVQFLLWRVRSFPSSKPKYSLHTF